MFSSYIVAGGGGVKTFYVLFNLKEIKPILFLSGRTV